MKRLCIGLFFALGLTFMAVPSHAILEARIHYGAGQGSPDEYNSAYFKFQDGPELDQQKVLGADLIFSPPMLNWGLGVRFEGMQEKGTEFNEKVEMDITRTSIIVNHRIVNTLLYFGPIVTYGVDHKFAMAIPTDPNKISSGDASSYSAGVEGGGKLGLFTLGAEVGYQSLKFNKLTESDAGPWTKNGRTIGELDLSGMYYKLLFGVGF